jgi:preprotein translocase subunit SecG
MITALKAIHILTCVFLVLVVLLQAGKGAEISASFGGSSQTVFGSAGGANFFTRLTSAFAAIFMITSLALTVLSNQKKSVFDSMNPVTAPAAPAPSQPQAAP